MEIRASLVRLKKILAMFLIAILLSITSAPVASAYDRCKVKPKTLVVRKSASTKSGKLTTLKKGAVITVLGASINETRNRGM